MSTTSDDRPPVVIGAISGIVTWILGYAFTFLWVGPDVQDSTIQRFIEAVEGEPATYEMVGWVFYNAHLVDTVFTDVPAIGEFTTNAIGGDDGFSVLVYLIPIGLLLAAGLAIAQYRDVQNPTDGMLAGLTVVPGYLVLTIVGIFLFEVSVGGATGRPELLEGILLAGIIYPAIFASAGGVLASFTD